MANTDDAQAKSSWAEWFQGNYRLMTDEEKKEAAQRLEKRYSEEFGKNVTVDTTEAEDGVLFGYALNIQKCIGCRRCVKACVRENNQSRNDAQIEWIRVIRMEKGSFDAGKMDQVFLQITAYRLAATPIDQPVWFWRDNTTTSRI